MAKFNRRIVETISDEYTAPERKAIVQDVVDHIRRRTVDDKEDKNNKTFKEYKPSYYNSTAFKEAGKKKGPANLKLSSDMMSDLQPLRGGVGKIAFGYLASSDELGKVEGHVTGELGKHTKNRKRDFLGISSKDLNNILARYPLEEGKRDESLARANFINKLTSLSKQEAETRAADLIAAGIIAKEEAEQLLEERFDG